MVVCLWKIDFVSVVFLCAMLFCYNSVDFIYGVSFFSTFYYHSYLAVVYSYRNTCNITLAVTMSCVQPTTLISRHVYNG